MTLHSQGAGFGVQRGKFDGLTQKGWHGELVFVRHPKEEKTRNPVYEESLPYVYGKVNAHHALRIQRFKTETLSEKYRRNGVTVARTRQVGAVVGISNPSTGKSGIRKFRTPRSRWNGTIQRFIFQTASMAVPHGSMGWKAWGSILA